MSDTHCGCEHGSGEKSLIAQPAAGLRLDARGSRPGMVRRSIGSWGNRPPPWPVNAAGWKLSDRMWSSASSSSTARPIWCSLTPRVATKISWVGICQLLQHRERGLLLGAQVAAADLLVGLGGEAVELQRRRTRRVAFSASAKARSRPSRRPLVMTTTRPISSRDRDVDQLEDAAGGWSARRPTARSIRTGPRCATSMSTMRAKVSGSMWCAYWLSTMQIGHSRLQ